MESKQEYKIQPWLIKTKLVDNNLNIISDRTGQDMY